jgi:hypothetical protein
MNHHTILSLLTCLTVTVILQRPSTLEAQDSCQPVFDALTKVVTTPSHSYSTYIVQGRTITGEKIYTQGKAFALVDGKWVKDSDNLEEILAKENEGRAHATAACKIVREESVNGRPATLYSLHSKTEHATEEAQLWIAKGLGLLLREEMDIDAGGRAPKSHMSARYEYGNIQPPI